MMVSYDGSGGGSERYPVVVMVVVEVSMVSSTDKGGDGQCR